MNRASVIARLKKFEGCLSYMYQCTGGKVTIGAGHAIPSAPDAGKPAKIADLFAGVRAYGLLGFLWFDADANRDWRPNVASERTPGFALTAIPSI